VNRRVGNARVRQIRVGLNPSGRSSGDALRWRAADVAAYSTCRIPAALHDALSSGSGSGCFREWGYVEDGVGRPNEFKLPYRETAWQSATELNTPGYYSVRTRMQLPGSGYVKTLANREDEALVDLQVLYSIR
jgi:hypothetical protein